MDHKLNHGSGLWADKYTHTRNDEPSYIFLSGSIVDRYSSQTSHSDNNIQDEGPPILFTSLTILNSSHSAVKEKAEQNRGLVLLLVSKSKPSRESLKGPLLVAPHKANRTPYTICSRLFWANVLQSKIFHILFIISFWRRRWTWT